MPTAERSYLIPLLVILAIGALAGAIRFTALSRPDHLVFDEIYYGKDGCLYSGGSLETCQVTESAEKYWVEHRDEVGSWVHPPMGKWLISLGIERYGMTPFGWRVSAAVAGTLSVMITAAIAWMLFRSLIWTAASGLLLATESLHVVQSRLALLDIFLCLWVGVGFFLLLVDRSSKRRHPKRLWRPWLWLAGMAFGAAAATKWSGATAMVGALVLAVVWEVTRLNCSDACCRTGNSSPSTSTQRTSRSRGRSSIRSIRAATPSRSFTTISLHFLPFLRRQALNAWTQSSLISAWPARRSMIPPVGSAIDKSDRWICGWIQRVGSRLQP